MYDLVLIQLPNPILSNPKMYNPLGILYLSSVVKKHGFSCAVVDLRDKAKIPDSRYVGFSCTTPEITHAKKLARVLGRPNRKTIVGGAHPSLMPQDCKEFDYVVQGEGEKVIIDILEDKVTKKFIKTERLKNLSLPYPDWFSFNPPFSEELFPGERYGKGDKAMTLIASRGCPFKCSYCGNIYNTPVIFRDIDDIIGEIKQLIYYGVRHFRFEDDNFTIHPQFHELCLELSVFGIRWKCHTRSDILTDDHASLMKFGGCAECGLGVESADENVLLLNNKKETVEDHIKAVKILKDHKLRAKTYFISGLPGETDRTVELNKAFFDEAKPDKWTLSRFTPYPGCEIFKNPQNFGVKITDWDYSKWWNFPDEPVYELENSTREDLDRRYKTLYEYFMCSNYST